jgi:DHA2 family multidrug resistance protein
MALGIGCLQIVLEEGQREDWFQNKVITGLCIVSVVSLVVFVLRVMRVEQPVVDIRLLRNRNVAIGAVLRFAFGLAIYASVFLYPVFVQGFLGWNATRTGLLILPGALITGMLMGAMGAALNKE